MAIILLNFGLTACGSKSTAPSSQVETNKVTTTIAIVSANIDEHTCIDEKLTKYLDSGESIKKMIANADIIFCNGVRLRLKTYQFTSKKYKAYGYIRSNSGLESCLTESTDYTHTIFLGDQGVLNGNNIKILVGGHYFDSNNKLVPSEHKLASHVKFDWENFNGELAIFEKDKVRCWSNQY